MSDILKKTLRISKEDAQELAQLSGQMGVPESKVMIRMINNYQSMLSRISKLEDEIEKKEERIEELEDQHSDIVSTWKLFTKLVKK